MLIISYVFFHMFFLTSSFERPNSNDLFEAPGMESRRPDTPKSDRSAEDAEETGLLLCWDGCCGRGGGGFSWGEEPKPEEEAEEEAAAAAAARAAAAANTPLDGACCCCCWGRAECPMPDSAEVSPLEEEDEDDLASALWWWWWWCEVSPC